MFDEDVERLRQNIDRIDNEIIDLLMKRLDTVSAISDIKRERGLPIEDPDREKEIFLLICSRVGKRPFVDIIKNIYREIIAAGRSVQ